MSDLRSRVLSAVAAEHSLPRSAARRRNFILLLAAGLISTAVFLGAGGIRRGGRPDVVWVATSAGALVIAASALVLAFRRGRSMLGRSRGFLIVVAVATLVLLLGWKVTVSSIFPHMAVPWPDRPGFRCLSLALATGLAPISIFLYVWGGTAPAHPRLTGSALGTASGAFSWVLLDLWCPVGYFPHLLLGHVLPLVLLAGIAAAAGGLLEPRRR